jgi:hypothetical protein
MKVIPTERSDAIAEALIEVLSQKGLRKSLSTRSLKRGRTLVLMRP